MGDLTKCSWGCINAYPGTLAPKRVPSRAPNLGGGREKDTKTSEAAVRRKQRKPRTPPAHGIGMPEGGVGLCAAPAVGQSIALENSKIYSSRADAEERRRI